MEWELSRWTSWRGMLVLLLAFFSIYAQSVSFGYVFDDVSAVQDNPALDRPLSEALGLSQHGHHGSHLTSARLSTHDSYRPLRHLSLWVDQAIFGKSSAGFHFHSVLAGGVAIVLVWLFLGFWAFSPPVRLGITALFALHPAQVESVAYISGRSDVEAAICALLCLLSGYGALAAHDIRKRLLLLFGACCAFLGSLAFKEAYILLPLLFLYLPSSIRSPGRMFWAGLGLALVAVAVGWLSFRATIVKGAAPLDVAGTLSMVGRGLRQALLVAVFPLRSSPVRPLSPGEPWVETVVYGLLGVAAVVGAVRAKKWQTPLFFGLGWFVLLLGPSLAAVHIYDVLSDHYLYLPLLGLLIALGALYERFRAPRSSSKTKVRHAALVRGLRGAAACWAVFLVYRTMLLIPAWENMRTLAELCVDQHPEAGQGWNWLADEVMAERGCEGAELLYRKAVEREPEYAPAWNNLSVCALRRGDAQAAHDSAKKSIRLSGGARVASWYNYALSLDALGRRKSACDALSSALSLDPSHAGAQVAHSRLCALSPKQPER